MMAPVIWLAFGLWAMGIQNSKGQSGCLGLILGLMFGPIGVLVCWLMKGRPCPYCRSSVHPEAVKCPKCQSPIKSKWAEDAEKMADRAEALERWSSGDRRE